jgi:hypothetical protein
MTVKAPAKKAGAGHCLWLDGQPAEVPHLKRIAFDQVYLIKGDTQDNQWLACLGWFSI